MQRQIGGLLFYYEFVRGEKMIWNYGGGDGYPGSDHEITDLEIWEDGENVTENYTESEIEDFKEMLILKEI